jgi:SAM-dependent methyltransferase
MTKTNIIHSINDLYKHTSTWGRILLFLILFAVVIFMFKSFNKQSNKKEGFISIFSTTNDKGTLLENSTDLYYRPDFSIKTNLTDIYDDFYANVYDDLLYYKFKNDYEIGVMLNNTNPTNESVILDIGSATGHYVATLASHGYNIKGVDISPAMIKKAQSNYPSYRNNFINGDALDITLFQPNTFTHITAMNYIIYYMNDKYLFFQNCMNWLMPGGYLLLHLVDKDNFNYKLPSSGIFNKDKNIQKYINNKRIIENKLNIPKYNIDYNSIFEIEGNKAIIQEKFKENVNDTNLTRKNIHNLYMETIDEIVSIALNTGFILQGIVDMANLENSRNSQFIYIFTKPN